MSGLFAYAAEGSGADLFLGYSFQRYNSAQTIPAFTAIGGIGTSAWIGGGSDIEPTKGLLLRPIRLDYLSDPLQAVNVSNPTGPSTNRNENNLRYTAGIAFNFGGAQ
jgi:hypothetical protein